MNRLTEFKLVYFKHLALAMAESPDHYSPHIVFDILKERMSNAIDKMSFNKDSPAFKRTCKELGINHTYKAIQAFINKENES